MYLDIMAVRLDNYAICLGKHTMCLESVNVCCHRHNNLPHVAVSGERGACACTGEPCVCMRKCELAIILHIIVHVLVTLSKASVPSSTSGDRNVQYA